MMPSPGFVGVGDGLFRRFVAREDEGEVVGEALLELRRIRAGGPGEAVFQGAGENGLHLRCELLVILGIERGLAAGIDAAGGGQQQVGLFLLPGRELDELPGAAPAASSPTRCRRHSRH